MKFEFNWPCGLICLNVLMGCHGATLAEKSKVNLDLGNYYTHCLIRFNIISENNDFDFNSFQKINFQNLTQ